MRDGKFLGLRVKAQANFGAYVSMFAPTIPTTGLAKVISGLYRIPAIRIDFDCAFTNTVPVDAIRGAGKPEALFLLERLVDIAAHETGRTPAELRRLNLLQGRRHALRRGQRLHLRRRRLRAAVRDGAEGRRRAGLRCPARRQRSERASCAAWASPAISTAPAASPTSMSWSRSSPTGWSPGSARRARARATKRSSPRSCRESLGVPVERIEVRQGDTRTIPHGGGTGGSSSTIISGTTLRRAADVVIQRGRDLAAERLETAPADIAYRDGSLRDRRHRPPHRPVRAGGLEAVRGRRRVRRQDRDPSRPASWSARSRSIPRPARCARPPDRGRRLRRRGQSAPARRPDAWRHRARRSATR